MPAFSHFFLNRFSARSKFSSSWMMTSDKICFPLFGEYVAGSDQDSKVRPRRGLGQQREAGAVRRAPELAWRPGHLATAEQMDVQMIDRLAAVGAGVDHRAVAGFRDVFLASQGSGQTEHSPE